MRINGRSASKEKDSKQILNIYLNLNKSPKVHIFIPNPRSGLFTEVLSERPCSRARFTASQCNALFDSVFDILERAHCYH